MAPALGFSAIIERVRRWGREGTAADPRRELMRGIKRDH